ncbi:MAG: hypothetical protein ABR566_16110, partial [Pyrinomonadaceae bacterium]
MKRLFLVLIALIIFGNAAYSQATPNGAIVEQTSCPPKTVGTYEQYFETAKNVYAKQIEDAKKDNIKLEMPTDFSKRILNREEFERRKAYTGIDCQRIKYWSDGLKVVGYIWKPK